MPHQNDIVHNSDCSLCKSRGRSIFCALKLDEVEALNEVKHTIMVPKGETLFQEEHYPRGLYCLGQGNIKLTQRGPDGKEQIIHMAKNGDVLGYRAILSGDKYSCSAIAVEDTSICFIPKDTFHTMVRENPRVTFELLNLFAHELKETEKKVIDVTQRPVKERVAKSLIALKENNGFEADQKTINIHLTREDLASIAGTTRESATRALFELRDQGLILLVGKKIQILELKQLMYMANLVS
jgi:CRP/FNR family transcriptional regulator